MQKMQTFHPLTYFQFNINDVILHEGMKMKDVHKEVFNEES